MMKKVILNILKASLMTKLSNIQDKLLKSEVISEAIFKMVDILDNAVSLN